MIFVACDSGADAVKFQFFDPVRLAGSPSAYRTLLESTHLDIDKIEQLAEIAAYAGIEFMCTPFHADYVQPLVDVGVKRIKLASSAYKDVDLLQAAGATRLPVIISNGMCNDSQLEDALDTISTENDFESQITILYCVSKYPAALHTVNLRRILELGRTFQLCEVGFSDHTAGIEASILAAAMGATVIEKHFTLDRTLPGPDQACSLEPAELKKMIEHIREVK